MKFRQNLNTDLAHCLPAEFLNLESMVEGIAQIWNLEPLLTVIVRGMEERCHVAS
jgi:hypothetical protein